MCESRTRYYAIGKNGAIIGGGTDDRDKAEEWLEQDGIIDICAAEDRVEARKKYLNFCERCEEAYTDENWVEETGMCVFCTDETGYWEP